MPDLFDAARLARDTGIAKAIDHAERVAPGWSDYAYAIFISYACTHPRFTTEAVRLGAELSGFSRPPDKRAWGAVARRARKAGIVKPDGYAPAADPKVHCSISTVWRSLI